jgi:hypothetical protein
MVTASIDVAVSLRLSRGVDGTIGRLSDHPRSSHVSKWQLSLRSDFETLVIICLKKRYSVSEKLLPLPRAGNE